ncbi:MAG: thiamine pyrophosphate-requiring protein [Acidimicrobiales bacterium]
MAGLLVACLAAVAWRPSAGPEAAASTTDAPSRSGRSTWLADCAVCHGPRALGTDRGPAIAGRGTALVDFVVRTGRMPVDDPSDPLERHPVRYTEREIRDLVTYTAGFVRGPEAATPDLTGADLAAGAATYRLDCAACHQSAGAGGALAYGDIAAARPGVPREVAEAIRTGPGNMPRFDGDTLDEQELVDVVAYVQKLRHDPGDRGGFALGHLGPVPEGLVAWLVGLGLMVVAIRLIGTVRADDEEPGADDPDGEGDSIGPGPGSGDPAPTRAEQTQERSVRVATVSDQILERLRAWGVDTVFGYPGDGINGLMGAFGRAEDRPRFLQARHEELAAFEAVGYAKFSGRVGVVMATSGPGAIHLLNGLYDAKLDHVPVVAIVGQTARSAMGGNYQQEVDLLSLYKDVASSFVQTAMVPDQFPNLIDRAIRIAQAERTVTCVIVPSDLQEEEWEPPAHAFKEVPSSLGWVAPDLVPPSSELDRAAEVLNAGERVAILVGQGARRAATEVEEVAELLGAGVAKALLGKDVLPDDLPYVTGSIGLLGTKPSWDLMMGCDTFLMIGSNLPYAQFLPEFGQARGVQIDIDGKMVGLRYPMEVPLVGDAGATLRALLPRLHRKEDRSWRQDVEDGVERWRAIVADRADTSANPINPQKAVAELSPRLPDGAILAADSGSVANWYARDIQLRRGMRGSLSGTLATMGPGLPYAFGAKVAHPDRPVFALVGDGAMQMNGINELITIAKYWQEWPDPRLVVLVLHNNDLNQVTWEQRAMAGDPKFEASQVLPEFPYAAYATSIGLGGLYVDDPDQLGAGWDQALASERPFVLDVRTDPEVPPLPPHVELEQAKALASAMLHGDPASSEILVQGVKGKVKEFLHR